MSPKLYLLTTISGVYSYSFTNAVFDERSTMSESNKHLIHTNLKKGTKFLLLLVIFISFKYN